MDNDQDGKHPIFGDKSLDLPAISVTKQARVFSDDFDWFETDPSKQLIDLDSSLCNQGENNSRHNNCNEIYDQLTALEPGNTSSDVIIKHNVTIPNTFLDESDGKNKQ